MKILRLYCPLHDPASQCEWALLRDGLPPETGRSRFKDLPKDADRVQLVIPASETLIAHARLPASANRSPGSLLAFAVEDKTLTEPDANQVSWLGASSGGDALAVVDAIAVERWRRALDVAGIRGIEVHSELLLLPYTAGMWHMAWNGSEGFVRTGKFEAQATDSGDQSMPPLALCLMTAEALGNGTSPRSIAIHPTSEDRLPDLAAWEKRLGLSVQAAGTWNWRSAPAREGIPLAQQSRRWQNLADVVPSLKFSAWITALALGLHGMALAVDWAVLSSEQRELRQQMEARFRQVFPEAAAVVDPLLQMRRNVAEARHAAGQPDPGDFLPMTSHLAAAAAELPADAVRVLSYEGGRMTVDLMAADDRTNRIAAQLRQAGLLVDIVSSMGRTTLTVRVQ